MGVSVFVGLQSKNLFQNHLRPADSLGPCKISRSAQNLKLTGRQRDSYLYRSRSLSHSIGPAEGTPPQPMQTDQNDLTVSCYVSERNGEPKGSNRVKKSIGICQITSADRFLA